MGGTKYTGGCNEGVPNALRDLGTPFQIHYGIWNGVPKSGGANFAVTPVPLGPFDVSNSKII